MHLMSNVLLAITKKSQLEIVNYDKCELVKVFNFDTVLSRVKVFKNLTNQNLLLVFNDNETLIRQVDFSSEKCIQTYSGHKEHVFSIQILFGETHFASCSLTNIKIFNIATGACLKTIEEDLGVLCDLQLTEQGHLVVCSSSSRAKIRILNGNANGNFECLKKIDINLPIKRVKVVSDDEKVVCFSSRKDFNSFLKTSITIWDMSKQKCLNQFPIYDEDYLPNRFEFSSFI